MTQASTHITIREAEVDDAVDVREVSEAAFATLRSVYRPTGEAVARQAERAKEGTRLVAEIEERVVGTVQIAGHEDHVHMMGLAVHPDFQRMGVARRMIEWVVARAPTLGHNVVALDTIRETGNVPLFESMGFRVVDEEVANWCVSDEYGELHDVRMERKIA